MIDRLELSDVTLVGHSMGGGEVVRYLSRHGSSRIARAVLVSAAVPLIAKKADYQAGIEIAALEGWRAALLRDRAKWIADNNDPFWTGVTAAATMQWGQPMMLQCSLKAMVECTRTLTETDLRAEMKAIAVPTLIVHGTADHSVPVHFARIAAQAPSIDAQGLKGLLRTLGCGDHPRGALTYSLLRRAALHLTERPARLPSNG